MNNNLRTFSFSFEILGTLSFGDNAVQYMTMQ